MPKSLIHFLLLASPLSAAVDFSRDVQPILNKNCVACHGGVKEAGEVSFIYRDKALGKGESGKPTVVPGKPEQSEMIARIITDDPDDLMPKPEHGPRLGEKEVQTLRQWIKEGAGWGEHWSFVAPQKHAVPSVKKTDWPKRDLDRFILSRLEKERLTPSREAAPEAWLRRASFDLIGLPPTTKELDDFQKAAAIDLDTAIAAETDRLLASPRFGERWASVWQDLARYADTNGYADDGRRQVWKYRDWLIDAFNRDLPFDRFTIDQIAGDLIPDATLEQKIAPTFHRLSPINSEGGTDDEEFRVTAVIDRMNTTWEAWLGVSFGCVQCHSHPYDPIRHEEFYTFMEFFNQSQDADIQEDLPKLSVPLDRGRYAEANELQNTIRDLEAALHVIRRNIENETTWFHPTEMHADAKKAKLTITKENGIPEFHADANAASGAEYTLTFASPRRSITALRLELLPIDLKTAAHTPEWGGTINKLRLDLIDPSGKATSVPFREVIADEAHPMFDPNGSIHGKSQGWGAYTKINAPRHATFVLQGPLMVPAESELRVTIQNGGMYLASFPMIARRGRVFLTDHSGWITHGDHSEAIDTKVQIEAAKEKLKSIPFTTVPQMAERDPAHPRATHVFQRGNWLDKGESIPEANTPALFPPLKKKDGSRASRLDLARWVASADNPLTARVAVNRLWLELFGTGIVPTPEDFGSAGEPPTHPELLDHLAIRFTGDFNWSIKAMLRELVTSSTYRQDSSISPGLAERDADNRLLARGPRQRLTAEMMRDHVLTASSLISHKIGGEPIHPPLPPGVWQPFVKDTWNTPKPGDPERYRRAVYIYYKRGLQYPLFGSFDAPPRDLCSKRRLVSNTPLQALTVLNDEAFHEAAISLSRHISQATADLDARIALGYRITTSRIITPDRATELRELHQRLVAEYTAAPEEMKKLGKTPQEAALAVVASVLINLDESFTR